MRRKLRNSLSTEAAIPHCNLQKLCEWPAQNPLSLHHAVNDGVLPEGGERLVSLR